MLNIACQGCKVTAKSSPCACDDYELLPGPVPTFDGGKWNFFLISRSSGQLQDKAVNFIMKNLLLSKAKKIKDMFQNSEKTNWQLLFGTAEQAVLWGFFASSGSKMQISIDWCVLADPKTPPRLMHTQSPMSDFYVMPGCDWDEKLLVQGNVILEKTMVPETLQQHVDLVAKQSKRAAVQALDREIDFQESRLAHFRIRQMNILNAVRVPTTDFRSAGALAKQAEEAS